jgi:hypothetical protein
MPLSEQTRAELKALRHGVELPSDYLQFMVRWIAFNRAYNELRFDEEETYRVMGIGDDLRVHWKDITGEARMLVSLECIGGDRIPNHSLLRPNRWVKSATLFLRNRLSVTPAFPLCANDPAFCRANKVAICRPIDVEPWERSEMAALLRLVYQIRCNLFHGEGHLSLPDVQTNHDLKLVATSINILNTVFGWLN